MRTCERIMPVLLLLCCIPKADYAQTGSEFIRKQGNQLVVGANKTMTLHGVNLIFDRMVLPDGSWALGTCDVLNQFPDTTPVTNWYSERHLQSLAEIGFNVIRMNLQYRIFEDDDNPGVYKQSGWNFLDTYVQWATNRNLYLILDMHIPPGGLQVAGRGACLWEDAGNQTRIIDLWKAIAKRYADEPRIAAYDILNEPNPTGATLQEGVAKWQTLAQQIVDSVRTVDANHLIIVERVNWIMNADGASPLSDWSSAVLNALQISVNDVNTIYDFHFYNPAEYAMQNEGNFPDDGNYPDVNSMERSKDGTMMPRDKNYLAHELQLEIRGTEPMFVGEWSPNPSTFNTEKGGYTYIRDLLDLMAQRNLNWTYYAVWNLFAIDCCTEGVVCCSGENNTTPAFQALIDLFKGHFDSVTTAVNVSEDTGDLPATFHLEQNYPNPFNPETIIRYQLPKTGRVTITIYNVLGQEVETLVNTLQPPGAYKITWQPAELAAGVYLYQLRVGNILVGTRKTILLK